MGTMACTASSRLWQISYDSIVFAGALMSAIVEIIPAATLPDESLRYVLLAVLLLLVPGCRITIWRSSAKHLAAPCVILQHATVTQGPVAWRLDA